MRESEALALIKTAAVQRRFILGDHAMKRVRERGGGPADIRNALMTATRCRWQPDNGRWKILDGVDLEGDELICIVAIDDGVVVVTVF